MSKSTSPVASVTIEALSSRTRSSVPFAIGAMPWRRTSLFTAAFSGHKSTRAASSAAEMPPWDRRPAGAPLPMTPPI